MVRQFNRLSAGIFAALILSSCTVVVEEGRPRPRPIPDEPAFCTRQYDPVCARRGDDRRTFANSCLADAAGYRIIRGGECRRERPRDPIACTQDYRPVCGIRQGRTRTFSNACEARAADYRIIDEGPC